jgi:hypothetical protein
MYYGRVSCMRYEFLVTIIWNADWLLIDCFLGKGGTSATSDTKSDIRRILSNIPSASTYGNPSYTGGFKRNTELRPHIAAHRCSSGTPVVLLDPVLSELYNDVVFPPLEIAKQQRH